ncbi:MAG: flagellar basal body L-ring protein FlgH [Planctomycetota bacterium]
MSTPVRAPIALAAGAITLAAAPAAHAQSLFTYAPAIVNAEQPSVALRGYSLFFVEPPRPTEFQIHDLVTIIVDESTRASSSQSLETEKTYETNGTLTDFPDIQALLREFALRDGIDNDVGIGFDFDRSFEGDGSYDRTDRITVRITATVIDVKPNGNLVLEARKEVAVDDEKQAIIVTGTCRGADISDDNSVLSTQLANLRFELKNEGEVRKSAKKGLIPRVMEALLAF